MLSREEVTMEGFGQRVIKARDKHGWTRRELARRAGLHEQHLAKVERGNRHRIEGETIIKLARALGCTSDYLLGLRDEGEEEEAA
jgi:transcriptional regulator with XRE-family HTH domain